MKLEKQVASLELSKELVELGLKVEGLFVWRKIPSPLMNKPSDHKTVQWTGPKPRPDDIPAYTVAELGEISLSVKSEKNEYMPEKWVCKSGFDHGWHVTNEDTEADARALMLIYLIKEGHVTVEELNNV